MPPITAMPYDDPELDDPQELVGVELPGDESVTREMAAAFADEFAQLGLSRPQILALYRTPHYAGAHQAWRLLGEDEIGRLVDESLAVWGRVTCVVADSVDTDDEPGRQPLRFWQPTGCFRPRS
ncbi:MAG: hypothetical protein HYZ58_08425 [Acidobacteria bacterium]|nr:hypothetical protein [Acidobacteriota bacterium]